MVQPPNGRWSPVLAALALVACGKGPSGLGIGLDLEVRGSVSDAAVASVRYLRFRPSGDERRAALLTLDRRLARRERVVYRPLASTRLLALEVVAEDQAGTPVATGSTGLLRLQPGVTVSAAVALEAPTGSPDLGAADAAPPDLGASPDAAGRPGAIAHWTFDDGAGANVKDVTGRGHDSAPLESSTRWTSAGHLGGALDLQSSGSVSFPSLDDSAFPSSGTLSFWFNTPLQVAMDHYPIFDNWDDTRAHLFARAYSAGDQLQICAQPKGGTAYAAFTYCSATGGAWHQLVITWTVGVGGKLAVYVDRQRCDEVDLSEPSWRPTQQLMRLGGSTQGLLIDEAWLFDRALTPSEIAQLP